MGKIRVNVKMPFGEIAFEGESGDEILELISSLPDDFVTRLRKLVETKVPSPVRAGLRGIVEFTTEGPIIIAKKKMSQYEAIGLLLYAMEGGTATASKLRKLLEASGIRAMVPARLNEMAKRGLVFKPDPSKHDWRLTAQGERWVEEEVLPKLRGEGA